MIDIKQAVKLAQFVASWTDEEREQVLTMADALKVAAAAGTAPVTVTGKKRGPKPKVAAVKDPNRPKRKYTKKAKVEEVATGLAPVS